MATRKIMLADASPEDLRAYLDQSNLDYPPKANGPMLRSLIERSGWTDDFIVLVDAAPRGIDVRFGGGQRDVDLGDPDAVDPALKPFLVAVMQINSHEGETSDVPVDIDGRMMTVPRDREVSVPYRIYEVIRHARKRVYDETETGLGAGRLEYSYPHQLFRVYEERDPEKLAAIRQRVAHMAQIDAQTVAEMARLKAKREAALL